LVNLILVSFEKLPNALPKACQSTNETTDWGHLVSLSTFLIRAGLWMEVAISDDPFDKKTVVSICTDILCKGRKDFKERGTNFSGYSPPNFSVMWETSSQATISGQHKKPVSLVNFGGRLHT